MAIEPTNAELHEKHEENAAKIENNTKKVDVVAGAAAFWQTPVGKSVLALAAAVISLLVVQVTNLVQGKPVDVQKVATDPALIESLKELKDAMLKNGPVSVPAPKTDKQRLAELEAYIESQKTKQVAPNNIPDVTAKPKQ